MAGDLWEVQAALAAHFQPVADVWLGSQHCVLLQIPWLLVPPSVSGPVDVGLLAPPFASEPVVLPQVLELPFPPSAFELVALPQVVELLVLPFVSGPIVLPQVVGQFVLYAFVTFVASAAQPHSAIAVDEALQSSPDALLALFEMHYSLLPSEQPLHLLDGFATGDNEQQLHGGWLVALCMQFVHDEDHQYVG
jgi:hypothetical protein